VPSPAYPVYHITTMFAGRRIHFMRFCAKNGFLPDLDAIPPDVARRAKLIFINYPTTRLGRRLNAGFSGRSSTSPENTI